VFSYCFEAVQRPVQPSDRVNEPGAVRPENHPEFDQLKPWTNPPVRVARLGADRSGDQRARNPPPRGQPLAGATARRAYGTETQLPSKLPQPPRDARR